MIFCFRLNLKPKILNGQNRKRCRVLFVSNLQQQAVALP